MKLFFITWTTTNLGEGRTGRVVFESDLCQAETAEEAKRKEMQKNARGKNTSDYRVYPLEALLNKYKIKIVKEENIKPVVPEKKPELKKDEINPLKEKGGEKDANTGKTFV